MTDIAQRLIDMEIKLSFNEHTIDQLNAVVVRQQDQIDGLLLAIASLRAQRTDLQTPQAFRSLRDELPPHY